MAASYLREQGLTPSTDLATALVYGIRTETKAGQTQYSGLDHEMLTWLVGLSNPSVLAQIEDAPLSVEYFSDMVLALQSTYLHGDSAFCILPQIEGPEVVGEVADLLARCARIRNVFCGAVYRGNFIVSVRTEEPERDASRLVVDVLRDFGHGGGHPHRAGGIIENVGDGLVAAEKLFPALRDRWLAACGCERGGGSPLVSRANIIKYLG